MTKWEMRVGVSERPLPPREGRSNLRVCGRRRTRMVSVRRGDELLRGPRRRHANG